MHDARGLRIARIESLDLTERDLAELHDLRVRAADFFAETEEPSPTLESLAADIGDLPEGYTRADEVFYLAYADLSPERDPLEDANTRKTDQRPVAYAEILRGWPEPGQWIIGILLVDPAVRGAGIGAHMVAAIEADARDEGVTWLVAGVIESRTRSMAFWRREGFATELFRRPAELFGEPVDIVRMGKRLG